MVLLNSSLIKFNLEKERSPLQLVITTDKKILKDIYVNNKYI